MPEVTSPYTHKHLPICMWPSMIPIVAGTAPLFLTISSSSIAVL